MTIDAHLTDRQILRLHHELLAPVAVHEIMHGNDILDETAAYTLDVMIAELEPDSALLCLALCAAHVAEKHKAAMPIAGALGLETGRIVHEFGPLWLAHIDSRLGLAHESQIMDLLEQMPEDFEALADLLDATRAGLEETGDSARICDILSQNARAFVDVLEMRAAEDVYEEDAREAAQMEHAALLRGLEVHGNVITFPRTPGQHARLPHRSH